MRQLLAMFCIVGALAACNGKDIGIKPSKDNIKVGFVYIGSINDGGYTQAHDQGRLAVEHMGITTEFIENVPETAECERAVRTLISQGCNVIYTNAYGHMDHTLKVAKDFPNVHFGHCTGDKLAPNVSTYYGKLYQARYLSGIAAGYKTRANKIGFVAAYPIPQVIRGINAFTLGVQSVNPDAEVEVIWTDTWYEPEVERRGAIALLERGCDVLAKHEDSAAVLKAAEEWGAFAVGSNLPSGNAAPGAYLTAPLFHWEVFYKDDIQRILEGSWKSRAYWGDFNDGMISLDELTANNDPRAEALIEAKLTQIKTGAFEPFTGPLYDQGNILRVQDKLRMTESEIWDMNWLIYGITESELN